MPVAQLQPFRPVSLTTTQRNALPTATAGDVIYNTTLSRLEMWNGNYWSPLGGKKPWSFPQAALKFAVTNNVYTPMPLGTNEGSNDDDGMHVLNTSSTTIGVGSATLVLPQATIRVGDTTGFDAASYLAITGPPAASVDTVWKYTGKTQSAGRGVTDMVTNTTTTITSGTAAFTAADVGRPVTGTDIPANNFIASVTNGTTALLSIAATGSHSGGTLTMAAFGTFTGGGLGTGTLAAGQTVKPANETLTIVTPGLHALVAQAAFDAAASGAKSIRIVQANIVILGEHNAPLINVANDNVSVATQPYFAFPLSAPTLRVEVKQTSGGVLNCTVNSVAAPACGLAWLSD